MNIIIAGYGKVGAALTRQLSAEGHDLTLIDSSKAVLESGQELYDVMTICGNCATMSVLSHAGVNEADLLIAATNADEMNLLCCLTAHGMNPKLRTIARIRNPEYSEQIYMMRDNFALSLLVNPERQAAMEIERLLKFPGFLKRESFAHGRVELAELRVMAQSPLCDLKLSQLGAAIKSRVLICMVLRSGKAIVPDGNFIIKEGDRLFITASTNDLAVMLKNNGTYSHRVKHVLIVGGGRISYYLAQRMNKSGIGVQIIEKDPERCQRLAELLPNVSIVNADASDFSTLDSERLGPNDALVTMTGLDELNMILSLYGKSSGVGQIITKLGRAESIEMVDSLSLGSIICPKDLCSNTILGFVRAMSNQVGAAVAVHKIADGKAEASEFRADSTTLHCGEPLKQIKLKKNVLVACILHGSTLIIPNGDSSFMPGDTVIVVADSETIISKLNDIFA